MGVRSGASPLEIAFVPPASAIVAWLCGLAIVLVSAGFALLLAAHAWSDVASGAGRTVEGSFLEDLAISTVVASASTIVVAVLAFFAAVAAAAPAIGGSSGRRLNAVLRVGPALPAVAFLVAASAAIALIPAAGWFARHQIGATVATLSAFNLPIVTERFRFVLRTIPSRWRVSAVAAGASPVYAFASVGLPRAWPGIGAVALNGFGEMLGETVIVLVLMSGLPALPLAAALWNALAKSASPAAGAQAEVAALVLIVVMVRFTAGAVYRRLGAFR